MQDPLRVRPCALVPALLANIIDPGHIRVREGQNIENMTLLEIGKSNRALRVGIGGDFPVNRLGGNLFHPVLRAFEYDIRARGILAQPIDR